MTKTFIIHNKIHILIQNKKLQHSDNMLTAVIYFIGLSIEWLIPRRISNTIDTEVFKIFCRKYVKHYYIEKI